MTVYFIQHGICLKKDEDPAKPLSTIGKKETTLISQFLKDKGLSITKVYHSGKLRAEETAQILSNNLSTGEIYIKSNMSPNDNVKDFCKEQLEDNSIYVGHLPHLEKTISYLITQDENSNVIKLKNSGVVSLERINSDFTLKWYILPEFCT